MKLIPRKFLPCCFCGSAAEATGSKDKGCIACRRHLNLPIKK